MYFLIFHAILKGTGGVSVHRVGEELRSPTSYGSAAPFVVLALSQDKNMLVGRAGLMKSNLPNRGMSDTPVTCSEACEIYRRVFIEVL